MEDIEALAALVAVTEEEKLSELDYFKNRGRLFLTRALIPDERGKIERDFSNTLKDHHERGESYNMKKIFGESPEQLEGAFTCFQWLGTNCGMGVLKEALKKSGYKIERIDP